jgi:hypothetical protein
MMGAPPHIDEARHQRGAPAGCRAGVADDMYDAALANLLAHASPSCGVLGRLWRTIRSSLMRLHRRRRGDATGQPPEFWFWLC